MGCNHAEQVTKEPLGTIVFFQEIVGRKLRFTGTPGRRPQLLVLYACIHDSGDRLVRGGVLSIVALQEEFQVVLIRFDPGLDDTPGGTELTFRASQH